jgi:hypothetical protein
MALKGKPISIGTSDTTIYTCPVSTEASIHGLVFANNTGSSATITLKVYINSLGTTTTVATGITVTANSTYTWPKPIDVNAGDYIQAAASTGSAIVCLYSVYEGSAPAVAVGFTPRGTWSSVATYAINDVVAYNGTSYLAMLAGTNQQPDTATTYWMILAEKGATGSGDVTGPASSVDSELALYSSTTGKVIKRASLTGIVKATSGVASAATAGTDYVAPGGALGTPSSGDLTNCTFPTLNQNTTGTAAGLSSTLAVTSGGTGATTLTGVLKGNGTSAFTAATAGTDYLAPAAIGSTVQAYDADLSAIAALAGTSGLLKKTAANTWSLDTTSYLSGSVSLTTGVTGTLPVANGGTNASSAGITAFNNITGYTASGATGTTSTNIVFSTSPTITTATITGYTETAPAAANSGTATTISISSGTVLRYTMTGNCTFTMPTATAGQSFIVILTQDATGGRTAVFTSVKWPSGTAPTITTTASTGRDILTFVSDGTNWYGTAAQAFA